MHASSSLLDTFALGGVSTTSRCPTLYCRKKIAAVVVVDVVVVDVVVVVFVVVVVAVVVVDVVLLSVWRIGKEKFKNNVIQCETGSPAPLSFFSLTLSI